MGRGIASLMDTLFLMLITAGAMAIIFYAAYHYGSSVGGELDRLKVEFYTRQVLRTLSAYTITRPGGIPDYLLAYMKEDVYNYKKLEGSAKELDNFLEKSLSLLSSAYDYAFTLRIDAGDGIYYVLGRVYTKSGSSWEEQRFACSLSQSNFENFKNSILELPGLVSSYTIFFFKVKTDQGSSYYPAYVTLYLWPSGAAKIKNPCSSS